MKLWLDDIRPAPEDWMPVKSVDEAIHLSTLMYSIGEPWTEISLDHDLGEFYPLGGDGIDYIDWLCEATLDPDVMMWPYKITIHSGNPVGRDNMMRAIKRFGPYNRFNYNSAWIED
jgi:hypothetical protein